MIGHEAGIGDRTPLEGRRPSTPIPFSTLLEKTAAQMDKAGRFIPHSRFWDRRPMWVIGVATASEVKADNFEANFSHLTLRKLPSQESPIGDSLKDAESKALSAGQIEWEAIHSLPRRQRYRYKRSAPITGMDEVNRIPQIQPDGTIEFPSLIKPERERKGEEVELVRERFANLSQMAKDNNWPYIPYIIETATKIHDPRRRGNRFDAHSVRQEIVLLNPDVLGYIATPEGFAAYQQLVGKTFPTLEKTAGGIKLEVLKEMGAIAYVTQKREELLSMTFDPTRQDKEYARALLLAQSTIDLKLQQAYIEQFRLSLGPVVRSITRRNRPTLH